MKTVVLNQALQTISDKLQEQKGRDAGKSGVSWVVCHAGLSSTSPSSRTRARSASTIYVVTSTLVLMLGPK